MRILIRNDRPEAGIDEDRLRRRAERALHLLGCSDRAELSVWLCSDEEIRRLHREFFGLDSPTNVISFPQREGAFGGVEPDLLGDVVISADTAIREGAEAGLSPDDAVAYYLIHGLLHLLGHDHVGVPPEKAAEMETLQESLFGRVVGETETLA